MISCCCAPLLLLGIFSLLSWTLSAVSINIKWISFNTCCSDAFEGTKRLLTHFILALGWASGSQHLINQWGSYSNFRCHDWHESSNLNKINSKLRNLFSVQHKLQWYREIQVEQHWLGILSKIECFVSFKFWLKIKQDEWS
jgi:hypothetical protein